MQEDSQVHVSTPIHTHTPLASLADTSVRSLCRVEGDCTSEKQTDQMQVSTCPPDMCQSTKQSGGDQFLPKSSQEGSVTVDLTLNVQYGDVSE